MTEPTRRPVVELDDEGKDLLSEYVKARGQEQKWAEIKKECLIRLRKLLEETAGATLNGQKVVTYKEITSRTFQQTKFKVEHPDLAAQYTAARITRPFRLNEEAIGEVL